MRCNTLKLVGRLAALAELVPRGSRVADIGTDHAYLPIELVQEHIVASAIAGDVHLGPWKAAKEHVDALGLTQRISVRLGDGITVLSPGEVDVVIIAGMGGQTIIEILIGKPEVTKSLKRLILQPMVAANTVRSWLNENQWGVVDERLVQEEISRNFYLYTLINSLLRLNVSYRRCQSVLMQKRAKSIMNIPKNYNNWRLNGDVCKMSSNYGCNG